MKRAIVVYDCIQNDNDKSWISLGLGGYNVTEIFPDRLSLAVMGRKRLGRIRVILKMLSISVKAIRNSGEQDVIVVWNRSQALFLYKFCHFMRANRSIISFLWYNPKKRRLNSLEKECLQDKQFLALTNTRTSIREWKEVLDIKDIHMEYFPDPFDPRDEFVQSKQKSAKYVFSGGYSGRDWETFLKVVARCPEISFRCIAHKNQWDASWDIPKNLEVRFNTTTTEYYSIMKNATVAVFVCKENTTAGLINVNKSIQYGIIPIITYNDAIDEYFEEQYKCFMVLDNNVEEFSKIIQYVIRYSDVQYDLIMKDMQSHLKENFSGVDNMKKLMEKYECAKSAKAV